MLTFESMSSLDFLLHPANCHTVTSEGRRLADAFRHASVAKSQQTK
jgi:hypothetical protein